MAKFVIAGSADCPYFAKIELLGDELSRNLPDFKLHKIVIQPNEWQTWLENLCSERGWSHSKSPIAWRELVDRGGKGMLIGGANDFQEYAMAYYGIKSSFISSDMTTIGQENRVTKNEIDEEEEVFREKSKPLHVCVSSAASGVAYGLLDAIARGDCLGRDTEITLRLLDSEEKQSVLSGVMMETIDLNYPLLRKVEIMTDPKSAFDDASVIILLDEIKQEEEESKEDWLVRNKEHFVALAEHIDSVAKPHVKVIVSGNGPTNFNIHMMLDNMSIVTAKHVVGVSRTLENNAKAVVAQRLNVNSAGVVDLTVWGNINGTHVIDVSQARVHNYDGAVWGPPSFSLPATEMIHDSKWIAGEFITLVEGRKEALETAMKHRACNAESSAVATLLAHWCQGAPPNQFFSLAVRSEGDYDIPEGLVYSVPVRFSKEDGWTLVKDLDIAEEYKDSLLNAVADLREETYAVYPRPTPPREPTPPPAPEEDKEAPPAEPQTEAGDAEPKPEGGAAEENALSGIPSENAAALDNPSNVGLSQPQNALGAQPSENPVSAQPSENPLDAQPSGNPLDAQPSGNPLDAQLSGNPLDAQLSENPLDAQPSENPVSAQPSENPVSAQPSENPLGAQPSQNPLGAQPSENP